MTYSELALTAEHPDGTPITKRLDFDLAAWQFYDGNTPRSERIPPHAVRLVTTAYRYDDFRVRLYDTAGEWRATLRAGVFVEYPGIEFYLPDILAAQP